MKFEKLKDIDINKLSSIGLLDKVIKELIKEELIKEIKIKDIDKKLIQKNWLINKKINNLAELTNWQKNNFQTNKNWEDFIERDLKWEKWCLKKFKIRIPDYYNKRKSYLDKYVYSLIRVKNEGLARELYLRIKDKESQFNSVAIEFSEGVEKKTGGLIGPVTINTPHPSISEILEVSRINQLWPPKKINNWWVILRLEEKIISKLDNNLTLILSKELGEKFLIDESKRFKKTFSIDNQMFKLN